MNTEFRVNFWDKKILKWEAAKYRRKLPILDFNQNVKNRRLLAEKLLTSQVAGRSVLEIGCGTGWMAETILRAGARSYVGLDISPVAINTARKLYSTANSSFHTISHLRELSAIPESPEVCFSLGLTDWLAPEELEILADYSRGKAYLHSYSSNQFSPLKLIHQSYVFLMYGHKSRAYQPQYFADSFFKQKFPDAGDPIMAGMGIGRILTNFHTKVG